MFYGYASHWRYFDVAMHHTATMELLHSFTDLPENRGHLLFGKAAALDFLEEASAIGIFHDHGRQAATHGTAVVDDPHYVGVLQPRMNANLVESVLLVHLIGLKKYELECHKGPGLGVFGELNLRHGASTKFYFHIALSTNNAKASDVVHVLTINNFDSRITLRWLIVEDGLYTAATVILQLNNYNHKFILACQVFQLLLFPRERPANTATPPIIPRKMKAIKGEPMTTIEYSFHFSY